MVTEPTEEAGDRCPEGLWPLPPKVGACRTVGEGVKGEPSPTLSTLHPLSNPLRTFAGSSSPRSPHPNLEAWGLLYPPHPHTDSPRYFKFSYFPVYRCHQE